MLTASPKVAHPRHRLGADCGAVAWRWPEWGGDSRAQGRALFEWQRVLPLLKSLLDFLGLGFGVGEGAGEMCVCARSRVCVCVCECVCSSVLKMV